MLEAENVTKRFGGLVAVDDVSITIDEGEIVGLIGPNGAGKTTLFNTVAGVYSPEGGQIRFNGEELVGRRPHTIAKLGIMRTFQTARTFPELTVIENVLGGAIFGRDESGSLAEERERCMEYLEFMGLEDMAEDQASSLTIAHRKQLELARALAGEPDLILVDEIGSGLTPAELNELSGNLSDVREKYDVSVFWIEHVMEAIMSTTDRIIVLNQGAVIAEGTPTEIQNHPQVAEAYLGGATA